MESGCARAPYIAAGTRTRWISIFKFQICACLPPAANEIYSDFKQGARLPPTVDFSIANSSKILMLFIFSFWKKVSSQIPLLSSHPCPLMVDPHIRYTKFCIGFKIRKSRCRTTLGLRFGLLKMVFECSIAWCDLRMGRAIVHW